MGRTGPDPRRAKPGPKLGSSFALTLPVLCLSSRRDLLLPLSLPLPLSLLLLLSLPLLLSLSLSLLLSLPVDPPSPSPKKPSSRPKQQTVPPSVAQWRDPRISPLPFAVVFAVGWERGASAPRQKATPKASPLCRRLECSPKGETTPCRCLSSCPHPDSLDLLDRPYIIKTREQSPTAPPDTGVQKKANP